MKINYDNISINQPEEAKEKNTLNDANEVLKLFNELKKQYRNLGIYIIDENIFIYRPATRKEYITIYTNEEINDFAKEELLCSTCTIFPEDFNFQTCAAGIPTVLAKKISEDSLLDEVSIKKTISYYRYDMTNLWNQIACIINEAFPNCDFEEIENWDMEKVLKYLSRAEWKMVNLRIGQIYQDPFENFGLEEAEENNNQKITQQETVQQNNKENTKQQNNEKDNSTKKINNDTIQDLKAKYPEMQWGDFVTSYDESVNLNNRLKKY